MRHPRLGPTAALAAVLLATVGCSGGDGTDVAAPDLPTVEPGTLTACVVPTPQRLEVSGDGWTGPDAEVLATLADEVALELEHVEVTFDELVSGVALNSMRCDVGIGGVVEADNLDAVVRTSEPYDTVERLVVAPAADTQVAPGEVTGRIGVEEEGPAADAADQLTAAEVVPLPSATDLERAVAEGQVDGALVSVAGLDRFEGMAIRSRVPTDHDYVVLLPLGAEDAWLEAVDESLGRRAP